jgi:hypothetical protein
MTFVILINAIGAYTAGHILLTLHRNAETQKYHMVNNWAFSSRAKMGHLAAVLRG